MKLYLLLATLLSALLTTLLVLAITFLLSSCSNYPVNYKVIMEGEPTIILKTENVTTSVVVKNYEAHIKFQCQASWTGEPTNPQAPKNLITGICVGTICDRNNMGPIAEVSVWSEDFSELDIKYVACFVYMPEWYTMNVLEQVEEIFPQQKILHTRHPFRIEKKETIRKEYCNEVDENFNCVSWF